MVEGCTPILDNLRPGIVSGGKFQIKAKCSAFVFDCGIWIPVESGVILLRSRVRLFVNSQTVLVMQPVLQ